MKQKIFLTILFSIILNFSFAQCKQQFIYNCGSQSCEIFLKDFNAKLKIDSNINISEKIYTIKLNKGTHYRFSFCSPDDVSKIYMKLKDTAEFNPCRPYAETWNKYTNKDISEFDFICQKTSDYYIVIGLKDDSKPINTCAVCVLSFVGKNK